MNDPARTQSVTRRLIRLGVTNAKRAEKLCDDPELSAVLGPITAQHVLLDALSHCSDPDLGLLATVRLCGALHAAGKEHQHTTRLFTQLFEKPENETEEHAEQRAESINRLFSVLGQSVALGDEIIRRPELLTDVLDYTYTLETERTHMRERLLHAVHAHPNAHTPVAGELSTNSTDTDYTGLMRKEYRRILLRIAAIDLANFEPQEILTDVAAALADLAAAALEAALAIARSHHEDHGRGVRIAVLGMGKTGGRELNYISDVDVIYVVEPEDGYDETYATEIGTQLASDLALACAQVGNEPALWAVDAALRPEGKQGPLVRTLASHTQYYERWAKTWEFQALLKARHVAGDSELSRQYIATMNPMVWQAVTRENFVEDAQAMRRRVENHVKPAEAERQIKLGKGGLRDVEFTVQLLQLVHGRLDESIRSSHTLTALSQLAAAGYVGREHAIQLAQCYRFLRVLEHRVQLRQLHRTHLMPTQPHELEVLARALGIRRNSIEEVNARWKLVKRQVRSLHEALFYRPLLPATAQLSQEEATLSAEGAQARLAAIGYRDPKGAMRHINALTEGVSRRAAIQRQLLPVLIGWFAEGAAPDSGLLAFRKLSDELGGTHWYLKLLRDSGSAAQRLALVLSTSDYVAQAISRSPEAIRWFDGDADLAIRSKSRLITEADAILTRADDPAQAATTIRALRRRELARIACSELLMRTEPRDAAQGITDIADVTVMSALRIARSTVLAAQSYAKEQEPAEFAIIAMGRMGGREMGYGSDADVMFVYRSRELSDGASAAAYAQEVALEVRRLLTHTNPEPPLSVDADLRPEGRSGPLVRSLDSYAEYYSRWSEAWESQALLRARPVAGDEAFTERFHVTCGSYPLP
ncbi:bifunctional [glutamine synthetase] adenylyltransferase/[glutamine synthetase]-adenylyl-L-tyrosine phosphorylase [Timonella sp. A28]|uniref:bifunctional [glutamine synthetase] adenylyltransferase/[glutamine synthetase]-adenylyl-L-tyrosine phosphorylase n=1 Tax=Timonella sp. A28 TaxID=3442640 RepID=UPI003EBAD916